MKDIFISVLQALGLAWWVEIKTDAPRCTYYFGPFDTADSAQTAKAGYIEDLEQEGAQGIRVDVKRCRPSTLTVFDDGEATITTNGRVFSGQH